LVVIDGLLLVFNVLKQIGFVRHYSSLFNILYIILSCNGMYEIDFRTCFILHFQVLLPALFERVGSPVRLVFLPVSPKHVPLFRRTLSFGILILLNVLQVEARQQGRRRPGVILQFFT
jgi:hypothetical protein